MTDLTGKRYPMNHEGKIQNYRYTGDKIFGLNPVKKLQLYRPTKFIGLNMSDHEMVIGSFKSSDEVTGGYLSKKKSRKHKNSKNNKSRKTQKSRKSKKCKK